MRRKLLHAIKNEMRAEKGLPPRFGQSTILDPLHV